MSSTTTLVSVALLRRIEHLAAAGTSDAAIADTLHAEGHPVPRDAAPHHAQLRRPDGYNLATSVHNPGRWTAAAIAEVRAAPEYIAAAEIGFAVGYRSTSLTV